MRKKQEWIVEQYTVKNQRVKENPFLFNLIHINLVLERRQFQVYTKLALFSVRAQPKFLPC